MSTPFMYRARRPSPGLLRTRFQVALLLCFAWAGVITLRLVYLQVIQHDYYIARAKKQRESMVTLFPERGQILDRKGRQLAISVSVESMYIIPDDMTNASAELRAISRIVPLNVNELLARMKNKTFLWIARKISREDADRIRRLKLAGVYFTEESRRYYPSKELAAHVVGFVGLDNKGLSGVEYQYDHVISGIPGKLPVLRDAKKRILISNRAKGLVSPTTGRTLQLTIDATIQHIVEEELRAVVQERNARGGAVIVMNPFTGEILALANAPGFNPNIYQQYPPALWKNRAIQDYYEPGSTFKPVVAAAALDLNRAKPDEPFDCQWGSIRLAGHIIQDHKPFGVLSFREIIHKSSNVGMIKVGLLVGPESLYSHTQMFGFGRKTGIDLPGEAPGVVHHPSKWSGITIGAFSIGQEIGVTPIQVLRMMSTIATGGYLASPHTVSKVSDRQGNLNPTVFQQPQKLPLRHSTFKTLQEFVEGVVAAGSGKEARIPGYRVAGKTGTAQRIGASGTYADGGYIASFVGYAPASNPAFSMIVIIDGPKGEFYGGRVAAPLFRKIGQQVLKYLDVPPDQIDENPVMTASASPRVMQTSTMEKVEPVNYAFRQQHHKLGIAPDDSKASGLVMPTLYGKTAGETIELLTALRLKFRIIGSGTVGKQWPPPQMLLNKNDVCIISLTSSDSPTSTPGQNVLRK